MTTFKTRIARIARKNGRVILANDYETARSAEARTVKNITKLHPYLCAVKLNFHLLLQLGRKEISNITRTAHRNGLQAIADIKLNDIPNTNRIATRHLWDMGFDAVIANPIIGPQSLKKLVLSAHREQKGVITLCHMSAAEARQSYEMKTGSRQQLYQLFLKWARDAGADGVIAGATFPDIVRYCSRHAKNLDIYSPGVGAQGGDASETVRAGTDYLIVGRTILGARDPEKMARSLQCF